MTDLTKLTIKQTLEGLKSKKFSAVELTKSYIKNCEENRKLNAYITETFDLALESAKKSDENIAKG